VSDPSLALDGRALALLDAIRARGSDATSLRDAAHEACHALKWGVKKRWTRDNIHAKKPRVRAYGVADEIEARAVEQLVCRGLGVDCGTVDHWAHVCWMETLKNERISLPAGDWLADHIRSAMQRKATQKMVEKVIALSAVEAPSDG
jgi:hypothetical protein